MRCKRWIIPLILVLLIACITPAYASELSANNGVAVTTGAGAPGTEVHLKVSIRSAMADSVALSVTYDKEKLELVEGTDWLIDGTLSNVMLDKGVAVWAGDLKEIKGDIFELVFRINEAAEIDEVMEVGCNLLVKSGEDVELQTETPVITSITVKNLAWISGTIDFFGSAADPVTVELLKDGEPVQTQTLENGASAYEFSVEQGEYKICVKKTKHCPREYEVSMLDMKDKVQDAEICLYGDVTGDGKVNMLDAVQVLKYYNKKESTIDSDNMYIKAIADVTGDEKINMLDAVQILKYYMKKGSVFDNFE